MSKYSAVYYPHTSMRSPQLLRNSLLLWDHVDCIVPWSGFSVTEGLQRQYAEAAEIILRGRVPQNREKKSVDKSVTDIFSNGTPTWIRELSIREDISTLRANRLYQLDNDYLIYPQKFLHETWEKLRRLEVARFAQRFGDWAVPPSLGLLLMSELANTLAGETQHTIRDRSSAYTCLFSAMTSSLGGEIVMASKPEIVSSAVDRLVTISVRVADPSKVRLEKIVTLRKREAKERASDFKNLRHKYLDEVALFSRQITKPALSISDRNELTRQFVDKMEADFRNLKRELGMARNDLLLSKEVGIAAVALAGGLLEPAALGPALSQVANSVGAGALVGAGTKYIRARRKALSSHSTSWLFLAGRPSTVSRLLHR